MRNTLGLYIHIPFCQKKCHYCDFLTFEKQEGMIDKYVEYLVREIELYHDNPVSVDTIYFGGGTPSYLSSEKMRTIMTALSDNFKIDENCEITIEMNPESVTEEKLKTYQECGFNRFSMGVQSFNDDVLKLMGRLHDRKTVFEKVALLKAMGCDNLSIDLMFANPKQSFQVLQSDISQALSLDVDHISCYSLMIKDHTPFQRWVKTGQIKLYDDELEREMYHYIQATFAAHGYEQYEISNFSKPGKSSRHNQKYWHLEDYLGLGLGAASNLGLVRMTNYKRFDQYYDAIDQGQAPILMSEELSTEDREKEFIMLNLRLLQGFNIQALNERFEIEFEEKYADAITKHQALGVVKIEDGYFSFTDFGLDVGNQFYLDIL